MWVLFYSSYRYFGLCLVAAEAEVSLAKLPSFDRHHENPAKILQIFFFGELCSGNLKISG